MSFSSLSGGDQSRPPSLYGEWMFQSIAQAAPVLLWVCNLQKKCIFSNNKWSEFTGQLSLDTNPDGWMTIIHPDDRLQFMLLLDQGYNDQSGFRFEFRLNAADGAYRYISGEANPFFNPDKVFSGFACTAIDVHEDKVLRLELEKAVARHNDELSRKNLLLIQKNRLVETVLDSTLSMITVVDREFRYITFNKQVESYCGVRIADVVGKNMFDVFPSMLNTDLKDNIEKALKGELVTTKGRESLLKSGLFFDCYFIPLRADSGEVEGVIIKIHDVTEQVSASRKIEESNIQLEQQNVELVRQRNFIETLFNSIVDVIAVVDVKFHYISINNSALKLYGFEKENVIGKSILELFPIIEQTGMYRDLQRAMKGEFVYDLSYTSTLLNRHFENYYVPLFDHRDQVYAVMIIGHDVSKLIEASEKLRKAKDILESKNQQLQRSNDELEQFAFVASHDLQEPIRKIATFSNKLLTRSKDSFSDETTTYLKRIHKSTVRMYELINGLLHYSRIARENNQFSKVSLQNIMSNVLIDFDLKIQQKRAVIQFDNLPEIDAVPIQMRQLFSNLISNSLKFARKDVPPVIQIAASMLDEEQKKFYHLNLKTDYIILFYVDNGIGFDQVYAEKVFELFQRLHERNQYDGSGIGLSICRKIITNHHGLIYAFSEIDKGVTFQIILPVSQEHFK
jgi:PAS domain S-box-containing protein